MSIARTSGLPGMDRRENEGRVSLQHVLCISFQ